MPQYEKDSAAVRYNGARRGTVSEEASGDLTKHGDDETFREPVVLVKDTPEVEVRPTTSLFGVVPETPRVSRTASLDSAYGSRPFGPDATFVREPWNETSELKDTSEKFCHDNDEVGETASQLRKASLGRKSRPRIRSDVRKKIHWSRVEGSSNSSGDEQTELRSISHQRKIPSSRRAESAKRLDSSSSSSTERDEHVRKAKPKHILKPPKYDGTTSFETFIAQFQNCASFNRWTQNEQLVFLRGSLEKEAGQVLWDYSSEKIDSAKKLVEVLRERFGGTNQADKYRLEVKNRRRKHGESLRSLHSDIRKLVALAFPHLDHKARELIGCDYFVDALDEPTFALKVRERAPQDLDSALRAALQLEVWTKDVDRKQREKERTGEFQKERKARELTKADANDAKKQQEVNEALTKRIGELERQLIEVKKTSQSGSGEKPASSNGASETKNGMTPGVCWGCGDPSHRLWQCAKLSNDEKKKFDRRKVRPIMDHHKATCVTVRYKRRPIQALIDTGSDVTIAGSNMAKKYKWKVRPTELKNVKAANGENMIIEGVVNEIFAFGKRSVRADVYITSDLNDLILGVDWLGKQGRMEWDFDTQRIRFGDGEWLTLQHEKGTSLRRIYVESEVVLPPKQESVVPVRVERGSRWAWPYEAVTESTKAPNLSRVYSGRTVLPARFSQLKIRVVNADERTQVLKKGIGLGKIEPAEIIESRANSTKVSGEGTKVVVVQQLMDSLPDELCESQRKQVRALLHENEEIFSNGEYDIGRTPLVECRIDTGAHRPIRQPLRRQPFEYLDTIDEQVAEMADHGIIEPAASPWASNVVLVRKKDGSLRFCVDYRKLNSVTKQDSYPLPLIDNCLNALQGASWFSTLDLRAGYYNIPIAKEDRDKTAFVTRSGCHRFTVMPFGLTGAPGVFQRLMDFVLCGLSYITCLVYLDDIIVFGRTFDEHLTRLREVFARVHQANLKLKPTKCSLFRRSVAFLGHVISEKGIGMQSEKIQAIRDWPPCQNLSELRAFLGTAGYYRRFVHNFSLIAAPLFALTKKGVRFKWTNECQQAFDTLKFKLMSEPILALPNDEGVYQLDCDASDTGLGSVLSQMQDGVERVIAYASRTLSKAESSYETTRKELLGIVFGLKQFRQYLTGRHFVIRTDHAALTWLRRTPEPMPQLARWLTFFEEFDYEIVHREGKRHSNADGLSRRPESVATFERNERAEPQLSSSDDDEMEHEMAVRNISSPSDETTEGTATFSVRENLPELQQTDHELGPLIKRRLESERKPDIDEVSAEPEATKRLIYQWERLEVRNGLVYRRNEGKPGEIDTLQLLTPRQIVNDVLQASHEGQTGGHFGIKRTLDQVRRRFYWPSWKADTVRFCRECVQCNEYHRGKPFRQGPLQPVVAGAPYERWYIDLTGPHPKSDRNHVYILTCVDSFTKWAEAFPLRNKEAETVAKVLVEQVFARFGTPVSLLSDQGKEVDGSIMRKVCEMLGIDKLRTTPYKPSTNQVERLHRSINAVLGKTVSENQRDWDTRLSFAMAAYRASRHESTGYTPNMLTLGREVRMPADIVYGSLDETPAKTYDGFVGTVQERMTAAYAETRIALRKAAERNKRYYDVRVRPNEYQVGSWVYYFNPRKFQGRQDKWERKYSGPFLIIATPSSVTVRLQRRKTAKPFTAHIDKVKPFWGAVPNSWINTESTPMGEDENATDNGDIQPSRIDDSNRSYDAGSASCRPEEEDLSLKGRATPAYAVDESPQRERPRRNVRTPARLKEFVRKVNSRRKD